MHAPSRCHPRVPGTSWCTWDLPVYLGPPGVTVGVQRVWYPWCNSRCTAGVVPWCTSGGVTGPTCTWQSPRGCTRVSHPVGVPGSVTPCVPRDPSPTPCVPRDPFPHPVCTWVCRPHQRLYLGMPAPSTFVPRFARKRIEGRIGGGSDSTADSADVSGPRAPQHPLAPTLGYPPPSPPPQGATPRTVAGRPSSVVKSVIRVHF